MSNPVLSSNVGDECLSLLEPLADRGYIARSRPMEIKRRSDEGDSDPELIAHVPKELKCLFEKGLPPDVLPLVAHYIS